jgi:uncharacterized protein (DUF488 family)
LYTIGFAKKNLRGFVGRLQAAGVKRVVDIRLNNTSQLAGYSKKDDLAYVLELVGIEYEHAPEFAPTKNLFDLIQSKQVSWDEFRGVFLALLAERSPETGLQILDADCLLCAEDKPDRCHRVLVAEYLAAKLDIAEISHLR